ncbi:MAG: prolyl oligopeptidase family serine peptidase [Gammaproteobacteria bacterium]
MCSKQVAPYGSWKSPITPELMLGSSVGLGEIQHFNDELFWIEMRPEEAGRYVIVKRDNPGKHSDAIDKNFNARTRVHEYGGASYLVTDVGIFFCNFTDQAIYHLRPDGNCIQLTHNPDCRYADMVFDSSLSRLICIREEHASPDTEAVNVIAAVDIRTGDETILVTGDDFYSYPRLSPDNKQLCWIAWSHPNMPWDTTTLCLADISENGEVGESCIISGGNDEAVTQPKWSAAGELYFVSDKSGWWNLYRYDGKQSKCVFDMEAEFAVPQWSFGEQNYDFIDNDNLLLIYWLDGLACLGRGKISSGKLEKLDLPFTDMESVTCAGNRAWLLAASPTAFPAILEINTATLAFSILRKSNDLAIDPGYLSTGKSVSFSVSEKEQAHAFYYAPANKVFTGPENEKPPLIVISHGGPTGASHNGLKMVVQFFTSRGFAVIDVNYGGSSGYGRDYRQRLQGQWGIVDVNDCCKAALYTVEQGWADNDRLAIRGGSAGGFTTLAALAFTDVFKAGASHYGVSDLEALARDTHKFESRYLDSLIGPYPEARDIYQQRSPINAVSGLSCPVIFFQGLEDRIVLPNQAEMMVAALKKKGIPVAYLAYEGEQHGFRQAKNIKRTLQAELHFYSQIFGFQCPDDVEPVVLES